MPTRDLFAGGAEPLHLAQARACRFEVREVHGAGLVMVREMAHRPPVGRGLDRGEGGVGQARDPCLGPLFRDGGRGGQRERGEYEAREKGQREPSMPAPSSGTMPKERYGGWWRSTNPGILIRVTRRGSRWAEPSSS